MNPIEDSDSAIVRARGQTDRFDLRILRSLRRIIRSVDIHSRRLAAQYEITAPQLVCLVQLLELGPVTVSTLAREVHLSPSTIVGILDRLEAKRLISRERSSQDRRQVLVSATDEGALLTGRAPSPLQDTLAEALQVLPAAEQETIVASLERVVELMEARHIDAAPMLQTGPIDPECREPARDGRVSPTTDGSDGTTSNGEPTGPQR